MAKGTGDLVGRCPWQQVHPDIQPEMVPCHSEMVCCPSMELAQDLSPAGHLLGPLSRCWPVGNQGWISGGDHERKQAQAKFLPYRSGYVCSLQAYRLGWLFALLKQDLCI